MAPIEELQLLWQNQVTSMPRAFDARPLSAAFRKYGRRQDIINIAKSVLIVGTLVSSGIAYRHRPLMLLSSTLLLLTAGLAVLAEWRIQRGIARLDFSAASLDFVRESIIHLQSQRNPFHTREYMTLFGGLLIGYNLMTVAVWNKLTVERRIATHALATVAPFFIYGLGRAIRAKRFDAELRPLIERLTALRDTLEERAL